MVTTLNRFSSLLKKLCEKVENNIKRKTKGSNWDGIMSAKGKLLGATPITSSYSITILKIVRKHLEVKISDLIGFYSTNEKFIIITSSKIANPAELENLDLLGSSTLTASNTVTLPKKVRELLNVDKGDRLAYYDFSTRRIMVTTG